MMLNRIGLKILFHNNFKKAGLTIFHSEDNVPMTVVKLLHCLYS